MFTTAKSQAIILTVTRVSVCTVLQKYVKNVGGLVSGLLRQVLFFKHTLLLTEWFKNTPRQKTEVVGKIRSRKIVSQTILQISRYSVTLADFNKLWNNPRISDVRVYLILTRNMQIFIFLNLFKGVRKKKIPFLRKPANRHIKPLSRAIKNYKKCKQK